MGSREAFDLTRLEDEAELGFGDLAQELLPPLQAVRMGVSLVRRDAPRATEVIKKIDATLLAMEHIVDELLDLSRERSEALLLRANTDLVEVCRSVITEASIEHPDRGILLNAHEEVVGCWDGERLRQAARNLVANALQYGVRDQPVELSVIDLGDQAMLTVVNRCKPIPPATIEQLFQPFQRGAGVGLYLVKRIVEAHRGSVEVDSDEVRTVFRVRLPKNLEGQAGIQRKEEMR